MTANTFEAEFHRRLAAIAADAAEIGETWTSICRATGISRATPDRWHAETPNTIALLDQMAAYVARRRAEIVAAGMNAAKGAD